MTDRDNLLDFSAFKNKKTTDNDMARGRTPLYVSHADGKVTGSPHFKRPDGEDFGDRLQRIKSSLEKINQLMGDLRKTTKNADPH